MLFFGPGGHCALLVCGAREGWLDPRRGWADRHAARVEKSLVLFINGIIEWSEFGADQVHGFFILDRFGRVILVAKPPPSRYNLRLIVASQAAQHVIYFVQGIKMRLVGMAGAEWRLDCLGFDCIPLDVLKKGMLYQTDPPGGVIPQAVTGIVLEKLNVPCQQNSILFYTVITSLAPWMAEMQWGETGISGSGYRIAPRSTLFRSSSLFSWPTQGLCWGKQGDRRLISMLREVTFAYSAENTLIHGDPHTPPIHTLIVAVAFEHFRCWEPPVAVSHTPLGSSCLYYQNKRVYQTGM